MNRNSFSSQIHRVLKWKQTTEILVCDIRYCTVVLKDQKNCVLSKNTDIGTNI